MAIVSKIREKSGLAVGIVALSLAFFIVGSDVLGPNSVLFGNKQVVGEVAGEEVSAQDYQDQLKQIENEYFLNSGKNPTESEMVGLREQAWNTIIFNKAHKPEFEKLGITVSDAELEDMVQGNNIHSSIKQAFTDPNTQKFDQQQIVNFLKNIDKVPPQQQAAWFNFERKLPDDRQRLKFENLLTKTNYVTTAEAKREYETQTAKADVQFLFVPFAILPDSSFKPSDSQLKDYLAKNKLKYKGSDSRTVEYVQFTITPSDADNFEFRRELEEIRDEFKQTENDTAFAKAKSDKDEQLLIVSPGDLPAELASAPSLSVGEVYGPFMKDNNYVLYKVLDVVNEGDFAAKASHILFKSDSPSDEDKKKALANAKNILKDIKGGQSFEAMAAIHGTDGTKDNGGDLGWFTSGRMVKPFEDAVFKAQTVGLLPEPVETDFGYHLIKITAPKTNLKYKVVSISRSITAGDETRDSIYRVASEFKAIVTKAADLDSNLKKFPGAQKLSAKSIQKSSTNLNDITDARRLVVWAFKDDTKPGEPSGEIFELNDRFVIPVLTGVTEENNPKLEDVKEAVENEVRKQLKAEQIIEKLKGASIEEMAKAYGSSAIVNIATGITLNSTSIADIGYDPKSVGRVFGIQKGKQSKPFAGENGVAVLKVTEFTPAPETKDFAAQKQSLSQKAQSKGGYFVNEALKDISKVKDNRVRFF